MVLHPMFSAPHDRYIVLWGPSGYIGTPLRCDVCKYDDQYRPLNPWVNYAGNAFTDNGEPAIYWSELPTVYAK